MSFRNKLTYNMRIIKKFSSLTIILLSTFFLQGCYPTTLEEQSRDIKAAQEASDNISIGKVQREIKIGMSNADVVAALGSPNMVTTDDQRREAWVYDKVSTEAFVSGSSGLRFFWLPKDVKAAGSTTQKTLTIIIKFDDKGKVRDFAYQSSKF
jgi:outer membrane protein assembly factor BamE (lipoprotein component of BamABCDE complex)